MCALPSVCRHAVVYYHCMKVHFRHHHFVSPSGSLDLLKHYITVTNYFKWNREHYIMYRSQVQSEKHESKSYKSILSVTADSQTRISTYSSWCPFILPEEYCFYRSKTVPHYVISFFLILYVPNKFTQAVMLPNSIQFASSLGHHLSSLRYLLFLNPARQMLG
jgi:hypothetical protein